ncbi:hypothetical protein C2857_006929 [Epichloe festucae Fl1]|uniref:F-box domain-containing protein n=1 Tax=Epichloe festucae (strain Fl1) TaxID=877507 RepID=A0A7S9KQG9_EPIFF|nr:hypothetical protein C2857_006929 [Epichloe festucae Fl1]
MPPPPAGGWPVLVPEILLHIFNHLHGQGPALLAAIRVNRHWFSCGTDVLWRRPEWEALVALPPDRRQFYAHKIEHLSFNGDEQSSYHERFKDLAFTNLKSISLDSYRPGPDGYRLEQYLSPSLESFALFGANITESVLLQLQTTCWRLRAILIDNPGPNITPSSFSDCIRACEHLQDVQFMYGMDRLLTDELLIHLAQRPKLTRLRVGKPWSDELMQRISEQVSTPFPALRSLEVSVASQAVPTLIGLIDSVTELTVSVLDSEADVIEALSSMTELVSLTVSFATSRQLSRKDILAVKRLSKLKVLATEALDVQVPAIHEGFNDADFDDVVSSLPALRQLQLTIQCDLSVAAIMSLSKHCPLVERLELVPVLDVQTLQAHAGNSVILPELRELSLGGFGPPGEDNERATPEHLVSLLRAWFPRLAQLDTLNGDEYSEELCDAFETTISQRVCS